MTVSLAPVLMPPGLSRRDDVEFGLDCPGAHQHLPMGPAGRHGKGGRNGDDVSSCLAQPLEQLREAKVVTDREAKFSNRGSFNRHSLFACLVHGGFPPTLASRQI